MCVSGFLCRGEEPGAHTGWTRARGRADEGVAAEQRPCTGPPGTGPSGEPLRRRARPTPAATARLFACTRQRRHDERMEQWRWDDGRMVDPIDRLTAGLRSHQPTDLMTPVGTERGMEVLGRTATRRVSAAGRRPPPVVPRTDWQRRRSAEHTIHRFAHCWIPLDTGVDAAGPAS